MMDKIQISIGDKEYTVQVAKTEQDQVKGLQGIESLPENEGMLFDFTDSPDNVSMWMKDVLIPLDLVFIDEDKEVIYVVEGKPNDEKLITIPGSVYVLEVNANSGIEEGDELEFEDDDTVMRVLAPDGSTQMKLQGGERIFSRIFTKQLIKQIKRAEEAKEDEEKYRKFCIRIGKKMFKEIKAQDSRPAEYVESPN